MNSKPLLRLLTLVCLATPAFQNMPLQAQEESTSPSITFRQYPSFHSRNPFTPQSPVLLQFSQPVDPATAKSSLLFYDKPNDRFADATLSRPNLEQIDELIGNRELEGTAENYLLATPTSPLPLGGTWYINVRAGLPAAESEYEVVESQLIYLGDLQAVEIQNIQTSNPYNGDRRIVIHHNKYRTHSSLDAETLKGYVTISPAPADLTFETGTYQIRATGSFDFGVNYQVNLREGILGYDNTQSTQSFQKSVTFEPNEGFVTYPAYSTTQNSSGHRKFDIKTGNLTGLRTRVKRLEGEALILALREYNDLYEGWGEQQTIRFESVAGEQIYDRYRETESGIDQSETISLSWDNLTEGRRTGAYYLCSEGRSSTRENLKVGAQSIIQLTDIGLAWKQSGNGTVVYAFSLLTGEPLANVEVRLLDEDANEITRSSSGENGLISIQHGNYGNSETRLYLDATRGEDRHVIAFHEDLSAMGLWKFSVNQRWDDFLKNERRTLIFTDRNLYKPGDEVKLKAISRLIDADSLLGPGKGEAVLRVFDPRHRKIIERDISFSNSGAFDTEFRLPTAGLGWHSVEIDFNPKDAGEENQNWRLVSNYSFQVEEYRVNTFEVDLENEPSYSGQLAFEIPVSANYYMGKSLSKANLQWNVYAYPDYPRPRGFDEFEFGDGTADYEYHSDDGTMPLSGSGSATIQFNLPEQSTSPGPRRVSLTAQVTDANQQTISKTSQFTAHSSDFYLGIRQPEGVHRAGDTAQFSIAAISTKGEAFTVPVEATLLVEKEIWNTVKVMGANGRMTHRNDRRLETVSETSFVLETGIDPKSGLTLAMPHQLQFEEAGDFILTLTARDPQNRPVITRSEFTVIGAEEPSWSWYDVIRIDLTPDKDNYQIGDTAKLLVRSPVFGHALLTTERGGVRSSRSIKIDQYETVIEIPIQEGDDPNIYASLLIIRGSGDSPHIHTSADYRLGYCELNVENPATELAVDLDSGDAKYFQPGEPVTVTAAITDKSGQPVSGAEVTFFAVDEGVLSLTGHLTPDPHGEFHRAFPLSVFTGQSLSDLLPENPLEQDFMNKGYVIGGGGANPGLDPDRVRKDFKALAFWEPTLITDGDGVVTTTFEAPDNLTTFRLMAVVAEGNRFAHAEKPVVVNKPLIIEPALPVFTNLTDQVDVTAVLHNNTASTQEIEIEVELDRHATFLERIGEPIPTSLSESNTVTQRITTAILDPGATETVSFPIALTEVGAAKWMWKAFSLSDPDLRDATESALQIGYPIPLLKESHSFMIRDGRTLENALTSIDPRLLDGNGEVEITLSNSRLIGAVDALEYLLSYPYGCVEQTTSSLIPWLTMTQLRDVMPQMDQSKEEVEITVQKGIDRLFSMQTGGGGLGYWPGANEASLWGSAYAAIAIALADRQEIEIPQARAESLYDFLAKSLRNTSELKNPYELSQRCLATYALALAGVNETSYHEVLFEQHKQIPAEGRALLALAMIESGENHANRIQTLLANDPVVPVSEVSWYKQPYIAATRLLAEVRHRPGSDRVDQLVDDLMKLRQPLRGWGSTYSNAWPLIALAEYRLSESATLAANDIEVSLGERSHQVSFPDKPASGTATFTIDGSITDQPLKVSPSNSAPVYATLKVAMRPALAPLNPENKGFSIERTYQKVENDGSITDADELFVGDLILVTLDLNLPSGKENYLAIDDPLPAIFEGVNPSFKSQATQRVNRERQNRTLYTHYRELKKDRMMFFTDYVNREGDYTVQYLARVVAPGEVTAPPAKIEAMYEPQRFGLSGSERITAKALPLPADKVALR
ncbi:MAG: alpha-2-macroglobulin family protein [Verrucomicrobiota bacterium]